MNVLVVNADSSSMKMHLIGEDDRVLDECSLAGWDGHARTPQIAESLRG
jgi:acetate kinase